MADGGGEERYVLAGWRNVLARSYERCHPDRLSTRHMNRVCDGCSRLHLGVRIRDGLECDLGEVMSRTAHKWRKFPPVTSIRYDDVVSDEERALFGRSAGVSRVRVSREAWHPLRQYARGEWVAASVSVFRSSERAAVRDELRGLLGVAAAGARGGQDGWVDDVDDSQVPTWQNRHSVFYDVL